MAAFRRYIGIDYSGAQTPTASLKGLRVYLAEGAAPPGEVLPPPSSKRYWTRRGVAEWLVEQLRENPPALIGIDHGFSFPQRYFDEHRVRPDWPAFLDDFQLHWPTDGDNVKVDFVRKKPVIGLTTPLIFSLPHLVPIRADSLPGAGVFWDERTAWTWQRRTCAMVDG